MAKRKGGKRSRARTKKSDRTSRSAAAVRWLWEWTKSLAVALLLFLLLRTFVVESFRITSGSMENTLLIGDFLLVNKAVYGAEVPFTGLRLPGYEDPARGDIVVLEPSIEGWEAPYVKRVVGVPGDRIAMRKGELYVNGDRLTESYVRHVFAYRDVYIPDFEWQREHLADGVEVTGYRPTRDSWGPLHVPVGKYFVMGDNRDNSEDSRYWGFVDRDLIKGRPLFIYYSFDHSKLRPLPWLTDVRWGRIGDRVR